MAYKTLPYNQSLSLLTDFYELTMAYAYWKSGTHSRESVFHLSFRNNPFKGGFAICCGLEYVADCLSNIRFDQSDIEYISSISGEDGKPIFEEGFLDYLSKLKFECAIDAVSEGTVVFPHEPLVRVQGPILQCQLLETTLLNIINFQTLIATKAARICLAAGDEPVIEFGLRRAQGIDGGLTASRAAFIGGCSATSNVLAGKLFGIPVKGTHGHSWVMSFDDELESFMAYAGAMPSNSIFLVDTYDTLEGTRNAAKAGRWLKKNGHRLSGIRLDSGDLAYLSKMSRAILDSAGLNRTRIVASNDLDENIIASLKQQGAKIDIWGVGTKLVTAHGQPALDGVYKLSAVRGLPSECLTGEFPRSEWKYKIKLSEQAAKISTPGVLGVRRYFNGGDAACDLIYDLDTDLSRGCVMVDPLDMTRQMSIDKTTPYRELLVPVFRKGECVFEKPRLVDIRKKCRESIKSFHAGIKRLVNPHKYPVGLEKSLFDLKTELVLKTRDKIRQRERYPVTSPR
jgi:nicotinate phosphoribosyltransferase